MEIIIKKRIAWNKGKKGVQIAWNKGKKLSEEHKLHLSESHKGQIPKWKGIKGWTNSTTFGKDEKHPGWKGNEVKYVALHQWISRKLGKPNKCEICESIEKKRYEWANKSGEYKRDLEDWIRLCVPCHKEYDLSLNN